MKKVLFYSSVKDKRLFNTQRFYQIDIFLLKNIGYDVEVTNKLYPFLKFWNYDKAFIYFYRLGLFPALLAKLFAKKIYFTGGIDSLEESCVSIRQYKIQCFLFKVCQIIANSCILVSLSDKENVLKLYNGKCPKNISFSEHTIDVDRFLCGRNVIKSDFITIAWMETKENVIRKGLDAALFLFKELVRKPEFEDQKLVIIGKEGVGTEYLKEIAKQLEITKKVEFLGEVSEVRKIELLKKSRYYFQLSKYEGFGIAALEALAARNIVIHSNQGGLRYSVGNLGILIDIYAERESEYEKVYLDILSYNLEQLNVAENMIKERFCNSNRQNQLKEILSKY